MDKALPEAPPKPKLVPTTPEIDLPAPPATAEGEEAASFDIVLVDMIASAKADRVITVKKNMYDTCYACISYRWGEVTEQVALTPDYNAHISSFYLDDLLIVCQQILNWSSDGGNLEPEVEDDEDEATVGEGDAVEEEEEDDNETAVDDEEDQGDAADTVTEEEEEEEEEEEDDIHNYSEYTIPYLWVDAISVNQMDTVHKKETIHRMTDIYSNAQVIIAVPDLHRNYLFRNPANAECLSTISRYGRKIYRHVAQQCWRTEEEEEAELQQQDLGEEDEEEEEDENVIESDSSSINSPHKHRGFGQFIKETIYHKHKDDDKEQEMVDDLCVLDPVTNEEQLEEIDNKDTDQAENQEEEEEEEEEECKCVCTDDMDELETAAYWKAVLFLNWLIDDWSARVWVISEYNIGRLSKMKLWFLSICYDNYAMRPRGLLNMFDPEEPTIYDALLQERPFLHMMLNSRATRNEDRFYAILPLTKYKKLVADHAIASWGITNDVSVRLVLYRLVSFEEKLTLLLCSILPSLGSNVILPSFAFVYQDTNFDWAWQLSNGAPTLIKAIDLITPTVAEDDKKQDQLVHLKIVVPWSRTFTDSAVEHDLDVSGHALACLGLTDLLDELVTVFVPITVHNEVTHHTLGIKLFGHREQNKWIVLHRMVDLVDVPPSTTPDVSTVSLPAPLHRTLPHRSGSLDTLWSVKKEVDQVFHIY